MSKNAIIGGLVAVILVLGGVYFYMSAPAGQPSQTVQTPQDNSTPVQTVNQGALTVVPAESKATYEINEKLQGKPVHVVGTTQAITGTASVDLTMPAKIQIGQIKLDATTFKTDIAKRDENVKEMVLKSDKPQYQYITFTPTSISGVPANVEKGKDIPVTIVGDMTILGVTKSVAFTGTVNVGADNSLTVKAKTKLTYGDFGVTIPNFSFLSDIDKTVDLSVELVAR